ncbi:MAG: hypothetical protein ACKVVO_15365 [Opitutaceae bacterium]
MPHVVVRCANGENVPFPASSGWCAPGY